MSEDAILRIVCPAPEAPVTKGSFRIVGFLGGYSAMPHGTLDCELELADRASTNVLRTIVRPFRAEIEIGGRRIVSTSMRARQDRRGLWDIVSHRADANGFDLEDGRDEMLLGRLAAAALGAHHVCETPETIGSGTFLRNVAFMSPYRTIVPTMPQRAVAAKLLDAGDMALGDLAATLHPVRVNGMTLACALMLRRCIAIDLEDPIGPDSVVRAVTPPAEIMPGLFDRPVTVGPFS